MIDKTKVLNNVKILTAEQNIDLLILLINKVEMEICNYCNIDIIPDKLQSVWEDLIVFKYNFLGKENLKSENLGSYSVSFAEDIPASIKRQLNSYRLLRVW